MSKVRTTINLNEDVVKKAKKLGINISAVAERAIIEYIKELENIRGEGNKTYSKPINNSQIKRQNTGSKPQEGNSMGLLRFELKSITPEATRIPSYPTGPALT